ncbi:hypothetical protein SAMN06296386_11297 [Lachnospiraceae bacterium]|nr:hypothetical protein SAMN06296386_11297 [Lachnospiraceae bacterium]
MSKGQRKMLWRRIRSRVKGLAAMILAVVMVVGLMPAMEVWAADQKAYYLFLEGYTKKISLTPGIVVDGLGDNIEIARTKKAFRMGWDNDILQLRQYTNEYGEVGDTYVDNDRAGGPDQIAYIEYQYHMCNFIGSEYQGPLKKGNSDYNPPNSNYSIELEDGVRYFKDTTTGNRFKTYLYESSKLLQINYTNIMKRTSEATEVTGVGAGSVSTIKTGTSEEKLYYAVKTSGSYFSMTFDGQELSWDGITETKEIDGRTYYKLPNYEIICTPFEITLQANKDYDVKYQIMNAEGVTNGIAWSIDIVGKENSGGDDPGKDDPGQGDPGQTVSENARTLVVKNKSSITKLFSKYGESGYKYRFKVEDKAQKKIARVNRKGKIRVKKAGSVKVSLFRKAKKSKWEKIEEQTLKTELPVVTKKVTNLKVGDTLDASTFITNQNELVNKPTSYVSTKPKVATVDSKTGKITILKKGSTNIKMIFGTEKGAAVYKTKIKVNG